MKSDEILNEIHETSWRGDGESFPEDGDDQGRLHDHLLELSESSDRLPYFVDSRCRIFQCLYEAEPQRCRPMFATCRPVWRRSRPENGMIFDCFRWFSMVFLGFPRVS